MTAIFEILFKYRPLLYEKGTLAFHPFWPSYVTWLLVAMAIAGSWGLYLRAAGALPRSWRWGLSSLRAAAFLVLILIFSQPVLRLQSAIPRKSYVAIAYDSSKSMEIRDRAEGKPRLDAVRELLRPESNPLLDRLADKFMLRFFRFSSTAERCDGYADTPKHGNSTHLERTLTQIAEELATAPVAGIVLVTDGADNRSMNLDATAALLRGRGIPVYAIGIGSPDLSRDVEVLRVTAPAKVLKDTSVEAEVSIGSTGYAGRKTKLQILEREKILQTQEITLGGDNEVKTYKFISALKHRGPGCSVFAPSHLPASSFPKTTIRRFSSPWRMSSRRFYTSKESRDGSTVSSAGRSSRTTTSAW